MSKYQEALDYFLDREEGDNLTVTCDWLSNAEELQELVDKATPMKPKIAKLFGDDVTICPVLNCRLMFGDESIFEHTSYCGNCGQKIDWSEECE